LSYGFKIYAVNSISHIKLFNKQAVQTVKWLPQYASVHSIHFSKFEECIYSTFKGVPKFRSWPIWPRPHPI